MSMHQIAIGDIFPSNQGVEFEVIEYRSSREILIRFTGDKPYESVVSAHNLRRGQVKNPYHPSVSGVGYMGIGPMKSWVSGKLTPEYVRWANMLKRCYETAFHERNPTYIGCSVCPEWHDFQAFSEWLQGQRLWGKEKVDLDKDLLTKGNKIYSPESCLLVPERINYLLVRPSKVESLPVGVYKRGNRYSARCRESDSTYRSLGVFDSPELAFSAYKDHKEKSIRHVAHQYRGLIDSRLYEVLVNYQVDP